MLDIQAKLDETNQAIAELEAYGQGVPPEALQMQEIMQRCVTAEKLVETNLESQLSLGREAYEAYCRSSGGKSLVSGADLPTWENLSDEIKSAWKCSAAWVAGRVMRKFGVMT